MVSASMPDESRALPNGSDSMDAPSQFMRSASAVGTSVGKETVDRKQRVLTSFLESGHGGRDGVREIVGVGVGVGVFVRTEERLVLEDD